MGKLRTTVTPDLFLSSEEVADNHDLPFPEYIRGCLRLMHIVSTEHLNPSNATLNTGPEELSLPPIGDGQVMHGAQTKLITATLPARDYNNFKDDLMRTGQSGAERFRNAIRLGNFAIGNSASDSVIFNRKDSATGLLIPMSMLLGF